MKITMLFLMILLPFVLLAKDPKKPGLSTSSNSEKKKKVKVLYKRKTEVDFSGENIEGDYKKPEGFHMVHRATTEFSEIVKFDLRFRDRVKKSVGFLE